MVSVLDLLNKNILFNHLEQLRMRRGIVIEINFNGFLFYVIYT